MMIIRPAPQAGHTRVWLIDEGVSVICFFSGVSDLTTEPEANNRLHDASFSRRPC